MGAIAVLELGTPCSTFSLARDRPGGPPPLRSAELPLARLASSARSHRLQLLEANELVFRSVLLFEVVVQAGGDASFENPTSSLLWQVPQMLQLKVRLHLYNVDFDQCQYCAPHRKPTRLLVSHAALLQFARSCPGDHAHALLQGTVRTRSGKKIFKTKSAQAYPMQVCRVWAQVVSEVVRSSVPHLQASFMLTAPAQDRKRQLGSNLPWKGRRQFAAGGQRLYQPKRGATKPLLDIECEPGQAIQFGNEYCSSFHGSAAAPQQDLGEYQAHCV